jgi:Polyketide synthase dehydratase domain/Polyketide synthase dehydratase N-terminal domain
MKNPATFYGLIGPDDIQQVNSNTFVVVRSISLEEHPFLSDHVIYGECLFPGAMMLELMAECGQAIVPVTDSIIIENFQILRPLKIPEARTVKLYAQKEPGGIKMSLCADYVKNGRRIRKDIVYAESVFKTDSFITTNDRNAFDDEGFHCFSLPVEAIYFQDFLQVGPKFQGLGKELCFSKTRFKGTITKTQSDSDFLIEPFFIDNCFQLGNIANRIFQGYEVTPVGIDYICFSNKLSTSEAYCYGMVAGYEDRVTIQHVILCDESDRIILSASGIRQHYTGRVKFDVKKHFQQAHVRTIHRSTE